MAEAVGHVDGDLDLVVECLGPGVGVAESDGPEDVVLASVGLPAWFDDLGDAAVGGPEDPSFQPGPGLVDGPSPFAAPVVVLRALASAARTPGCRLPAPHPDHRRGSGTQRGIVRRHVLDDHLGFNGSPTNHHPRKQHKSLKIRTAAGTDGVSQMWGHRPSRHPPLSPIRNRHNHYQRQIDTPTQSHPLDRCIIVNSRVTTAPHKHRPMVLRH